MTPFFLAFPDLYTPGLLYFDQAQNLVFLLEIICNFFSAFYKDDHEFEEDYCVSVAKPASLT